MVLGAADSGPAAPILLRAAQLESVGRWQQAIQQYDAAIKINDRNGSYFLRRAINYRKLHDVDRALVDLGQAKKLDPRNITTFFQLAIIHQDQMEDELAAQDLTNILAIDPKNAMALRVRAACYQNVGKYDLAIADLKQFMVLVPAQDSSDVARLMGQLLLQAHQPAQAVVQLSRAIKLDPKIKKVHKQRGEAYMQLKNYKAAIEDLTIALREVPSPVMYHQRADAYRHTGQNALADQDERLAKTIGVEAFDDAPFLTNKKKH